MLEPSKLHTEDIGSLSESSGTDISHSSDSSGEEAEAEDESLQDDDALPVDNVQQTEMNRQRAAIALQAVGRGMLARNRTNQLRGSQKAMPLQQ